MELSQSGTASDSGDGLDATLTSRYECKYLVDQPTADALRRYLAPHTALDPYSERCEDHRYRVLSLYLDSAGLRLHRDTMQGVRNRYKLRLRYYAETGDDPVFFEVKKRANIVVRKMREKMSRAEADGFLRQGRFASCEGHGKDLGEFIRCCNEVRALPALRLRYWREAWESRGPDPVRITFDTGLEHCMLCDPGLVETRPDWRATPLDGQVILEVKFTTLRPHWLDQMLRVFELDKVSVAKYAESIEEVHRSFRLPQLRASMSASPAGRHRQGVA